MQKEKEDIRGKAYTNKKGGVRGSVFNKAVAKVKKSRKE